MNRNISFSEIRYASLKQKDLIFFLIIEKNSVDCIRVLARGEVCFTEVILILLIKSQSNFMLSKNS